MAEKKITKKDMFTMIIEMTHAVSEPLAVAGYDAQAIRDFANHEIALLDKKSEKAGSSKAKKENEEIMDALYLELVDLDKAVTISEFQKESEVAAQYSNQKISALFKLMDGTRVEKAVVKGKSYFKAI